MTGVQTCALPICDVLLVNPGSPVLPRSEMGATFAVLTVKEGERPEAEFYKL